MRCICFRPDRDGFRVLTYSSFYNIGVREIWDMVYEYIDFVKNEGWTITVMNRGKYWDGAETINEQLRDSFYQSSWLSDASGERQQSAGIRLSLLRACWIPILTNKRWQSRNSDGLKTMDIYPDNLYLINNQLLTFNT